MKMELIASGKQPPDWVTNGFNEYQRRLPPECALILTECNTAKRIKGGRAADYQAAEEQILMRQIKAGSFVVALDKSGRQVSTEDLSSRLAGWLINYPKVQFLIGGPDGLSQNCLARAPGVADPFPYVRSAYRLEIKSALNSPSLHECAMKILHE